MPGPLPFPLCPLPPLAHSFLAPFNSGRFVWIPEPVIAEKGTKRRRNIKKFTSCSGIAVRNLRRIPPKSNRKLIYSSYSEHTVYNRNKTLAKVDFSTQGIPITTQSKYLLVHRYPAVLVFLLPVRWSTAPLQVVAPRNH